MTSVDQKALAGSAVPDGWPTNEMIEAGRMAAKTHGPLLGNGQSLWHIFRDMLAAAPRAEMQDDLLYEDMPTPSERAAFKAALLTTDNPAASHWHGLYRQVIQFKHDDSARFGAQIVALEGELATKEAELATLQSRVDTALKMVEQANRTSTELLRERDELRAQVAALTGSAFPKVQPLPPSAYVKGADIKADDKPAMVIRKLDYRFHDRVTFPAADAFSAAAAAPQPEAQPTEAAQPQAWSAAFGAWWSENRVKTHNLRSAEGFSRKAFHAGVLAAQKGGA